MPVTWVKVGLNEYAANVPGKPWRHIMRVSFDGAIGWKWEAAGGDSGCVPGRDRMHEAMRLAEKHSLHPTRIVPREFWGYFKSGSK